MKDQTLLIAAALLAAMPAAAQDIAPVISPGQAAEGAFYRSRMAAQAKRQRSAAAPRAGSRELQRQACANRPIFRKQYGASDPRLRKLEALCAAAGY